MDRVIFSAEPTTFLKVASPVSKPAEYRSTASENRKWSTWYLRICVYPRDWLWSQMTALVVAAVLLLSRVWLCDPHRLQLTRLPCPLLSPRVYSNSCPLSWWCSSSEQIKMLASYSDWVSRLQQMRLSPWGWGALTMEHTVGVWPNQPGFPGSSQ